MTMDEDSGTEGAGYITYSELFIALKTGPYAFQKPVDLFWDLVERGKGDECWIWKGKRFSNGYGNFRDCLAHRVSYVLSGGILCKGEVLRHRCDCRACVNPDHLIPGTQKENMQDMVDHGRVNPPKGEKSGNAKLTWESVFEIRRRYTSGETQKVLAEEFGISAKQISVIVNGQQWLFDMDTYQSLCLETCIYPGFGKNWTYPALGLASEIGEVCGKLKKIIRDKGGVFSDADKQAISDELGDVTFYLAVLAFELGLPFGTIARMNLEKLRVRKEAGKIGGSGDNR